MTAVIAAHRILLDHFADLRDGRHGGEIDRAGKEAVFVRESDAIAPVAISVLDALNTDLLLGTGWIVDSGVERVREAIRRSWSLSWPEQQAAGLPPIAVLAHFGHGFHHPHLRGNTVEDWPLNVECTDRAEDYRSILTAIAVSDLHNLVFAARTVSVVPATVRGRP